MKHLSLLIILEDLLLVDMMAQLLNIRIKI